jgi:quinol monooxygenase YgiN
MYRCAYRVVAHSKSDLPRPFRVGRFSWLRLKEFVSGAIAEDSRVVCRAACVSKPRYDGWRRSAVKPYSENARMIHVFATITAQPGQREVVLALFNKNRPAVLAETGCISYEAVVDVPDFGGFQTPLGNDTFAVVERWESTEALKAHAASAHMAEYGRNTAPLLAKRAINVLHAV